ncbi:coiled-coil domain-containing protein 144A-like isoform X1 [Camelus dromedarius]|uniref:coiled-coil domain-containing protein 144A-like isoform X1 n=1 Tax=Camelus dromedarius TaxID=9838 RepID=UPI003119C6E6
MKKRLAKFVSWVGFSARQRERRDHEHPVPRYPIRKHELKKFHKAAYLGDLDTVEVLLLRKKNFVHSRDRNNRTALHLACTSGQSPVVTLLIGWRCDLNARDKEGKTALIKAVQCRKEACVSILLEQGADPNLADDFQNTALHYAVLAGNTSVAAELLRYDANIEAINEYNMTPFLLAVRKNKEEMVKFLMENGANVHAVDKLQRSALTLAVYHDSPDIVKLLLEKRVNADSLDSHGRTAEEYAYCNGFEHLYQLIVDYRAGKIPNTSPQNSDLGQSSAKESLPSSHPGAENIQEKLQLSSKDNKEEVVVELGTNNGSCMDSVKNVEQKKVSVTKVAPRFEDISVSSISPKHDIDDSRPPSDGNLDLAPKKVRHPRFAKLIQAWEEPMINTEAKDGVLKPGTSTFFEDNNSNNENEDAVRTFSQPSSEVSGFSHPAFPAPEPLRSSAVLGVTEEETTKPKTGGKENGTRTINSVVKEQADHSKLISVDGVHKSDRGGATSALGLEEKEDVKSPLDSESISEIQLLNCVDNLSGAAGRGEKNTLNGQIENSTEKYPHLKPAVGVKDSVPNKTGEMKNLQTFKSGSSDWDSTSLSLNNKAGQRAKHLKVDKCPLVSQSVTTNQSAPTELRQTALVDKDRVNIGAVSLSENAALRGLCESQLPEKRSSKEADPDFQRAAEEEQERLDGSENNLSQVCENDKCVSQARTVKEKKSEDQINQINLSLVHLQKTPREPEVNKENDRKDVPVSSKHSCVEKHEDMWVKQGKFDWKHNSEFITKKSNQKMSKIHEKGKITFHRKGVPLPDNSELHGDLKELPSNVTDNTFDFEEKDAPGASVAIGFQAVSEHKEPSLENVFASYSKSESRKYGCQSSSKLYLNENKLDENDKPDTEHVFNKTKESFRNDRENEVRNRVPFTVNEDQEFATKRKPKRSQNTHWKSDIGRAPQVEVEENRSKSGELKGSETICDGSYHEGLTQQRKRGKTDDQRFPALQKGDSDSSCPGLHMKGVKNESGKRTLKASVTSRVFAKTASLAGGLLHRNDNSSLSEGDQGYGRSSKKMSTKKDKVTEQVNSVDDLDDLTLAPETASEDHKSLSPNCKSTLRLIEQLGPESKDSDRLLKIEDPVHSFRSIELKESDCALLTGKIKEMENKVNWLQAELLKTREAKSQLKLQNVEWERQLCSMRLTLEQETKKKKNAYILYENTKDDLKRKEEECNEQVSANQELESTARALECKRKSIRNKPNQVLEEQNDAQRQLSREQNARVIQDEILARHLSQQKEAEKTNKKMNAEDTKDFELSDPEDNSEVLPQQLPEAERQFRGQEIELHPRRDALRPTTLVFECVHRDRGQAQRSNKETESLSQSKQGEVNRYIGKQAFLEERVCELKSENVLLRQQLEAAQSEATSKKTILNIPAPFLDHLGKLEAMSRRVLMLEEGNKELIDESRCLKDRLYQYVTDRAEMEACMRQLQQELTDTRKKVSMLEASLEVTAHHHTNSENETQDSERRSHQAANPNADLPAEVKSTSSVLLHLSAETQLFLKELLSTKELQKKSDTLEEEKKKLEEEVVHLRHHLKVNTVERSPVEQYKRETEERARRDVVEKLKELSQVLRYKQETEKQARQDIAEKLEEISQFLQAQAVSQEILREYKRASVSQVEHKVKGLEPELKSANEKELEKYRQLYLAELENRMSLESQLNLANERLAAVSTELQLEQQHQSSLLGSVPARPVDGPPSDESSSTSLEPERSLTRRRNLRNFSDPSTSMSDLFRMRKKLENNIARELKEAAIELESKSYRLSCRLNGQVKSKSRSGFEST